MIKKILILVLLLAPTSLLAQKFAHFSYSEVMQSLPDYQKANGELQTIYSQYEKDLTDMQNELKTKYEKYQKEVNESTPQQVVERKQQEINDLQKRLQDADEANTKAFQAEQQKRMQPIIQRIINTVNEVAKEGGYVYILDVASSQNAGVFINESLSEDVTKKIMNKLGITEADIAAGKAAAAAQQQQNNQ